MASSGNSGVLSFMLYCNQGAQARGYALWQNHIQVMSMCGRIHLTERQLQLWQGLHGTSLPQSYMSAQPATTFVKQHACYSYSK